MGRATMVLAAAAAVAAGALGVLQGAHATHVGGQQQAMQPAGTGDGGGLDVRDHLRGIFSTLKEEEAIVKLLEEVRSGRCSNRTDEVEGEFADLIEDIGLELDDFGGPQQLGLRKCFFAYGKAKVAKLLKRKASKAQFKVNFFALLSDEEAAPWFGFRSIREQGDVNSAIQLQTGRALSDATTPPPAFDWVGTAVDPQVQNQGSCGGCWAFSASECISAINWIENQNNTHSPLSLSAQQLISCDTTNGNQGCSGGNYQNVWGGAQPYSRSNGLASTEAYPYASSKGTAPACEPNVEGLVTAMSNQAVRGTFGSTPSNNQIVQELAEHPMSIAIYAKANCFQYYSGGTLTVEDCQEEMSSTGPRCPLDHAILLVGYKDYDATQGTVTLKVKNSWGDSWGDGGYAYFDNGYDLSQYSCTGLLGINMEVAYPSLAKETAAGEAAAEQTPVNGSGNGGGDGGNAASCLAAPVLLAITSSVLT